ncbi:MAG: sensor histidine kinase [Acidimicrobiales bacterium]
MSQPNFLMAGIHQLFDRIEAAGGSAGAPHEGPEMVVRLRAALEHVAEGVVIWDTQGQEAYRNSAAHDLIEPRPGGVLVEQALNELLQQAWRGERAEQQLDLFLPSRRTLWIQAFPIGAVESPQGAVAVLEDASARHRLYAIRRDFVANVSHELKTPVGALILLAETIDGEEDPEVVTRLSARLSTEAERLGRIIDDLLDLSRIEANEGAGGEPVLLARVLRDAVDGLRPMADRHRITVELEDPPASVSVAGHPRDLVSAVANLIENAIKYSEPRSEVRVEVRVRPDESWVEITVSDQGIGIPARDLERVFERFYRVDRARSRSTGGTGLGLAIVRHVAANHGGSVEVTSIEGEGSAFTLRLPISAAAPDEGVSVA